jgi:SAM-dependent methyltransferase
MRTQIEQQKQVESYWNDKPCDSDRSALAFGASGYFREIEADRYSHQRHIKQILSKINWSGKDVLEIGTGVGTDARYIISRGALYTGVNVDQGSTDLTARALEVFALSGKVERCSATELKYADGTFSAIYSFGVLHHIPEVTAAVSEIHRVLRPGGELLLMLYNRSSINYYIEIMFLRKLFRSLLILPGMTAVLAALGFPRSTLDRHRDLYKSLRPMTNEEWLSRNTDGPDNPYSRVYSYKEAEGLLHQFRIVSNDVYFFDQRHWGFLGRMMPRFLIDWLGRHWGWHRVIHAIK